MSFANLLNIGYNPIVMSETFIAIPEGLTQDPANTVTKLQLETRPLAKNSVRVVDRLFEETRRSVRWDILRGNDDVAKRRWGEWAGYTIITQELDHGAMFEQIRMLSYQADLAYLQQRFGLYADNPADWLHLAKVLHINASKFDTRQDLIHHIVDRYGSEVGRFDRSELYFGLPQTAEQQEELEASTSRIVGPRLLCITNPDESEAINRLLAKGVDSEGKPIKLAASPDGYVFETYEVEQTSYWDDKPTRIRRIRLLGMIEYSITDMQTTSKVAKLTRFIKQLDSGERIWQEKALLLYKTIMRDHFGIDERVAPRLPYELAFIFMGLNGTKVENVNDASIFAGGERLHEYYEGGIRVIIAGAYNLGLTERAQDKLTQTIDLQ